VIAGYFFFVNIKGTSMPNAAVTLTRWTANHDINIAMISTQPTNQGIKFGRLLRERENVKAVVLCLGEIRVLAIL
jgi:hypothetical protein